MCVPRDDILNLKRHCVWFSDVSGSPTSTSIWIRLKCDMEVEGIVARYCWLWISPAGASLPAFEGPLPRQRGSSGRQSRATIPFSSMFMYFRESKPKFHSPNSFSAMAEITLTTVLWWKYQRLHKTNSRKVIQITQKCTAPALQCVYSHTHMWRSHGRSWLGKAEKGEVTFPLMTIFVASCFT